MLRKGAIPIPPARKTAGLDVLLWRLKEPIGPSILTPLPAGKLDNARLKTVSRMRVVTRISSSDGELTMEKVWVMPSDGPNWDWDSDRVRFMYCPALNTKLFGLSN